MWNPFKWFRKPETSKKVEDEYELYHILVSGMIPSDFDANILKVLPEGHRIGIIPDNRIRMINVIYYVPTKDSNPVFILNEIIEKIFPLYYKNMFGEEDLRDMYMTKLSDSGSVFLMKSMNMLKQALVMKKMEYIINQGYTLDREIQSVDLYYKQQMQIIKDFYSPKDDATEDEVSRLDELLDKINKTGIESLTENELKELNQLSK